MWTYKRSWLLSVIIWGKKIRDVYCRLTNALIPTMKKEAAFLWQRTGLYKYISHSKACACLQYGLMDQYTPLDLSSSNHLPTSPAMPCHYRGPSEQGRMLPLAVAGRTGRQDGQAGWAGRTGRQPERRLPAKPQTPAHESQTPCCGNTNTRSGNGGLMTICPQMVRIFLMFVTLSLGLLKSGNSFVVLG